jgi:hypothetical protein
MRTVTNDNRKLTATDEIDSVFGTSLIACLGNFLPYSVVKKYEGVERLKLFVRMSLDDGVDMMVIINGVNVYNKCITYSDCSDILFALDDLSEITDDNNLKM